MVKVCKELRNEKYDNFSENLGGAVDLGGEI